MPANSLSSLSPFSFFFLFFHQRERPFLFLFQLCIFHIHITWWLANSFEMTQKCRIIGHTKPLTLLVGVILCTGEWEAAETGIVFSKHTQQNLHTNPMNETQARGETEGEFGRIHSWAALWLITSKRCTLKNQCPLFGSGLPLKCTLNKRMPEF